MGLTSFIVLSKSKSWRTQVPFYLTSWSLCLCTLLLAACSWRGVPEQVTNGASSEKSAAVAKAAFDEKAMAAKAGLEDDIYYHIVAAELAGQFEDFKRAGEGYEQALALVDQVEIDQQQSHLIARRAWEIGRASSNAQLANQAAQRWQRHDVGLKPRLARVVAIEEAEMVDQLGTFEDVLTLEPAQRQAFAELLAAHYGESDSGETILPVFEAWLEQYPDDLDVLKAAAQIAEGQARYAMAYQWWSQLTEHVAGAAEKDDSAARAAVNLRMLGAAAEAANRLHQLYLKYPDSNWIALEYGRALLQSDQAAAAADVLSQLSADLPSNSQVHYTAGFAYFLDQQYEQATSFFELALNKGYDEHEGRYWLGLAWLRAKQPEAAIHWLGTLSEGSRWERAQQLLGYAYADLQDWDALTEHFATLRLADSAEPSKWYLAEAQAYIDAEQFERALASIHHAVALEPEAWRYRYQRGVLFAELGDYAAAETDLRFVLEVQPEHAHAMNALGYMLIDNLGDTDAGVPLTKRALELEPDSAPIMDSYGWGLLLQGRYDDAIFWLGKAWLAHPDHEIGAHYGEALWRNGQQDKAREIWRAALKLERGRRPDKVRQAYERLGIAPD